MDNSPRKTQLWLIITAAVLAVLTLYYYTGSWVIVVLFFAVIGALVVYQTARARTPSSYECVRCGAKLNPNARECNSCGSANWTIRN
jgi:ribosomal protein L40E